MKKLRALLIVFVLFTNCAVNRVTSNKSEAFIRLASGFKNDTVSLNLNGTSIFKNEILNSKENGITGNYVRIIDDTIVYYNKDSILKLNLQESNNDNVRIEVIIDNRPYSYVMYFNRGKYLFISKHSYYYNIYFNQFKKKPELY